MDEIAFVVAPRQNSFFVEIVAAIRDELDRGGVRNSVHEHGFPPLRPGLVYALVPPHEWFALAPREHAPTAEQLRRTVGICAEQPGSSFFDDDLALGGRLGALLDVNAASVRAFRRQGLAARHFPLGWTPTWSHVEPSEPEPVRDVDVLHLGIFSERRARAIAANAHHLERWRCKLDMSDHTGPNYRPKANYTMGADKWDLLRRSRVLLNVHVSERPYFEWQRIVQAASNGCVVVSEHSTDHHPLEIGEHFLAGGIESLGLLMQQPLEEEDERRELAWAAWHALKEQLPFSASVRTLIEAAEDVAGGSVAASDEPPPLPRAGAQALSEPLTEDELLATPVRFPGPAHDDHNAAVRAILKSLRLEVQDLRRALARRDRRDEEGGPVPLVRVAVESPSYRSARPRVSVVIPLFNHERHIAEALDSVAASRFSDVEVVVVDDGSGDGSGEAVIRWSREHPAVPLLLLEHPVNRGLGAARNAAVDFARGEFAFALDADNALYPRALGRLVAALDADPEPSFAYGLLAMFSTVGPLGLRSVFPWAPLRLRMGNYIDAMALWRTAAIRSLGGYTDDTRLHGWEDYDLWCAAAERGHSGVHLPQVIGRYRVSGHSMLSLTDISAGQAVSVLTERHPRLMGAVIPPM